MNRLQHCPIFFAVIPGITTPLSPLLTAFLTAYCVCNFNLFEYDRKPIKEIQNIYGYLFFFISCFNIVCMV